MKTNLKEEYKKYKNNIMSQKGARDSITSMIEKEKQNMLTISEQLNLHSKALIFLQEQTIERRKKAKKDIEDIGTTALQYIYDNSYELILNFVEDKKKEDLGLRMEFIIKNTLGNNQFIETGLIGERGGGIVEVVAFSLRIAALNLLGYEGPLIIDEAYKSISHDYKLDNVAVFLKQVTQHLNRQIIFATHKQDVFGEVADKMFEIQKNNDNIAVVKEIKHC
jgi:hypothetical protein